MSKKEYEPPEYMKEVVERYEDGESVKEIVDDMGLDVAPSTIYYHFDKMGIETGRQGRKKRSKARKAIEKIESEALTGEAEKIANIAFTLGGIITRRHLPLLDRLMSRGMTLEQIAEEIMDWYLSKQSTQRRIEDMEYQIKKLKDELSYAYGLSLPNFRYELRTRILWDYAVQVLRARMIGVRIPVKQVLKAFYRDLMGLERELEEIIVKEPELIGEIGVE